MNIYKNPTENETYSDPQNVLSAWHAKENKTHTETEVTKGNIKTVYDVYGTGTADAYTIVKTYSVTPASENTEETDTLITTAYYYGEDKSDPADPTDLSDCTLSLITAPLNTLASGTGQSASLIIPGTENQINGSYEYTNSASQKVTGYYSFVRGIEIDLATDANGYDTYSVITPSTGDGFEFAGTNTSGVSVSGSGTKSDAYTASSDYYTCTNSDSTKYVNSDAENVKTNH